MDLSPTNVALATHWAVGAAQGAVREWANGKLLTGPSPIGFGKSTNSRCPRRSFPGGVIGLCSDELSVVLFSREAHLRWCGRTGVSAPVSPHHGVALLDDGHVQRSTTPFGAV